MRGWVRHLGPASWAAIVALVMVVGYDLFAPDAYAMGGRRAGQADLTKIESQTAEAEAKLVETEASVQRRTWKVPVDQVGPQAMDRLTAIAKATGIQITSFRPQRTDELTGLTRLNYLVIADGTFPTMMAFVRELEKEDSLVAVRMVQLANTDGATDAVRGTVGISAFVEEKESEQK